MEKLLIKGKFISFEKEFYGLFIIFLDYDTGDEKVLVAAGSSSFISTYSIDMPSEKLVDTMRELIDDEEASVEKSKEIKSILQLQTTAIKDSMKANLGNIETTFLDILKKYLETNVEISLNIEKVDSFNFVDVQQEKQDKEKKEQEIEKRLQYKIPAEAKVIDCFIVLSPIKGKPIIEIEEGDLLLSKIDDTSDLGKEIAQNYKLYTDNKKLKPVIGKVYKKFHEGNELLIILQLAKDLMGMAREDSSVKVTCIDANKIINKKDLNIKREKRQESIEMQKEIKIEKMKNETAIYIGFVIFIIIIALLLFLII